MRNFLITLLAFAWLGFSHQMTYATDPAGADITWDCASSNGCQWEMTFTYYKRCDGSTINPLTAGTFNWGATNQNCNQPGALGPWSAPQINEITPICPGASTCQNPAGFIFGFEQFVYKRTYDVCGGDPAPCTTGDYTFTYYLCCRNPAITTMPSPQNQQLRITSSFTPGVTPCNNSPKFNSPPKILICAGFPNTINMGANDVDGDDLSYSLVTCRQQNNWPATYLPGYSGSLPFGPDWNVTFDPTSGVLDLAPTPGGQGVYVVCLEVEEQRNGVVIGKVVRDVEVYSIICNNNDPTLSGVDNTTSYDFQACVGFNSCFDVHSSDPDAGDNLTINVLSAPPGLTVTSGPGATPIAQVCWTPTASDLGSNTLVLEVVDDKCPLNGSNVYTYNIDVDNCSPCDQVNTTTSFNLVENLLNVTVTNTSTSNFPITFTKFDFGDGTVLVYPGNYTTPVNHTYAVAGTYTVCVTSEVYVGNECCHTTTCQTITVSEDPCDDHDANFIVGIGSPATCTYSFIDVSFPTSNITYWDFGDGSPLGTGGFATHTYAGTGFYTVTMYSLYYPNGFGGVCCIDSEQKLIKAFCLSGEEPFEPRTEKTSGEAPVTDSRVGHDANQGQWLILPGSRWADQEVNVTVLDMAGRVLETRMIGSTEPFSVDNNGFAQGVYMIRLDNGNDRETLRVIKY